MNAIDAILFAKLSDGTVRQVPLDEPDRINLLEVARQMQGEEELKVLDIVAPFELV
jgi:hypothetical protein